VIVHLAPDRLDPEGVMADDDPFEDLNPFLVAFLDNDVHTHRISGPELGQVFLHL
jgi:hypothetical protein